MAESKKLANTAGKVTHNELFLFPLDEKMTALDIRAFIDYHRDKIVPKFIQDRNYYEGRPDITKETQSQPDYRAHNTIVINFASYLVDTFNGFFAGIPMKISHDKKSVNDAVNDFNKRNNFSDKLYEISKMTSIYGRSYARVYQNEDSRTCVTQSSVFDTFVIYDDSVSRSRLGAVVYSIDDSNNWTGDVYLRKADGIVYSYNLQMGRNNLELIDEDATVYHNIPIIEFNENEERIPLFSRVKSVNDAINKALSEKADDIEYFADAYLKILGADIDEETLTNLIQNRIINLSGNEASNVVVDFLQKPNADTESENLVNRLEKYAYLISNVPNINDETFGTASSGVALQYKLQPMRNLAAGKERKFSQSLGDMYRVVFNVTGNVPSGSEEEWQNLHYNFTQNIPANLADEANTASTLTGITSQETQLSVLSIVPNPSDEIKKIKSEQAEQMKSAHESITNYSDDRNRNDTGDVDE